MKTTIIILLLFLFIINGFAQNLNYSVHGRYAHPITKEKLSKSKSMSDIIPYYPVNWIKGYNSTEISAISDGNTITTSSANDILSDEQLKMLNSLDHGTEIVINIGYQYENPVTHKTDNRIMHYSATVVPETEAAYPDGYEQLSLYIKENAIDKISSGDSKDLQQAVVRFTIDEEGEIADAKISRTSGDPKTDKLLVKVIKNMPRWKPAEDSGGIKVKQDFEFSVGTTGC